MTGTLRCLAPLALATATASAQQPAAPVLPPHTDTGMTTTGSLLALIGMAMLAEATTPKAERYGCGSAASRVVDGFANRMPDGSTGS